MIKVNVISVGSFDLPEWDTVWSILDSAVEADILQYKKLDHIASSEKEIKDCDAIMFLDMAAIYRDKPFAYINKTDTEEDIVEKIQLFANKIVTISEEVKEDINKVETVIYDNSKSIEIDLDEISEEITSEEINKLRFNLFEIEINGQTVRLSKEDILTLSKMQKLMKVYGYRIRKVIQ